VHYSRVAEQPMAAAGHVVAERFAVVAVAATIVAKIADGADAMRCISE